VISGPSFVLNAASYVFAHLGTYLMASVDARRGMGAILVKSAKVFFQKDGYSVMVLYNL
jgi:hypothetical protein